MYICVNTFEPATGCRGWSPLPLSLWACFQLSTYEPSRSSSGVYLNCLSDTHLFFLSLGGTSQFFQRHAEIPQLKLTLESSRASLVAQTVTVCLQCGRAGFDPWFGKVPWRREQQPTPVCLPGEFHGQRSLASYSPWSRKELGGTE